MELWSRLRFRDKDAYNDDWPERMYDDRRKAQRDSITKWLLSARDGSVPDTVPRRLEAASRGRLEPDKRAFLVAKMIDDIFAPIHPCAVRHRCRVSVGLA